MPMTIRTSAELRQYAFTNVHEPIAEHEFRARFSELLARVPDGFVAGHGYFSLPAESSAWCDTGIDLQAGAAVTLFATAPRASASEADSRSHDDPRLFQLAATQASEALRGVWYRIGADGRPSRGPRATQTFVAPSGGRLFLAAQPLADPATLSGMKGERAVITVPSIDRLALVVQWIGDPLQGVKSLRAGGDVGGLLDCEIARQQAAIELPDGWRYAPAGAEGEQFAADAGEPDPVIGCYCHNSGTVLTKDLVLPLLSGTTLRWAWKTLQLASHAREDRLPQHNYTSLAVVFDNGRDLSYHWSAELAVGTAYACPVPGWEDRETHVVVRSGLDGIGQWLDESRDIYADYSRYMGDPPSGIAGMWLIASTMRGRTDGWCDYGRIELANSSTSIRVN